MGRSTAPWPRAPRHGGVTAGRPPPAVFPPRGPTRPSQAWRGGSGVGTAVWSGAAPLRGPRSTAPQGTAGCPLRGSLRPVRLLPHGAAPSPVQRSTAAWISHCAAPSVHGSLCVAQLLPHCIAPCPLQSAVPMHSSHQQDSYCTAPQCTAFNCTAPPCTASYCVMPSILHSSPVDCSSLHSSTLHGSLPTAQLLSITLLLNAQLPSAAALLEEPSHAAPTPSQQVPTCPPGGLAAAIPKCHPAAAPTLLHTSLPPSFPFLHLPSVTSLPCSLATALCRD